MNYRSLVYSLFFFSGISGLMYEVVWLRMLSRVTGVTMYATATVLAAFMAGLALGSFLFGRIVDKRDDALRIYAILEFLVALVAVLVPHLFSASIPLYQYVYQISGESNAATGVVRAVVSFLSLLIPTTVMGGTLPVLTACLVRRDALFGKNFSILYGLNTLGAVAGVLLSGFGTIGTLGEWWTIYIGVAINVMVAIAAFVVFRVDRRTTPQPDLSDRLRQETAGTISPYEDPVRSAVLIAFGVSGFTSLAYEVIWTRQLILFLETSIYAFAGMLAIFLTGLALGSMAMHRIIERLGAPLSVFGFLELAVGLLSVLNLYLFAPLDSAAAWEILGWFRPIAAAFLIVFPMTFVFGMIFPVAGLCYTKDVAKTGSSVGWLYGSNTVGSIFGSLFAGFLLIPVLGSTKTVLLLAFVNMVLGCVLLIAEPIRNGVRRLVAVPIVLICLALTAGTLGKDPFLATVERRIFSDRKGEGTELFLHREGIEGTITAFSRNHRKQLWINGLGMTELGTETKLMAHLPMMIAKDPKEVLIICFGMGTTTKSAAIYPDVTVTTVELVPETFDAFKYFHPKDEDVLKKENVKLIANDGRNYLLFTKKKFDVISVDPAPPIWSAGTVNLYSREFFMLCREHLTPEGVMCLWFPGDGFRDNMAILRTFSEVFPETTVFAGPHRWGFYFVGTLKKFSWEEFVQAAKRTFRDTPALVRDLSEYDKSCVTTDQLLRLLIMDSNRVEATRLQGELITDDYPFTEFFLWRRLFGAR